MSFEKSMKNLMEVIFRDHPEITEVLEKAKAGEMTEAEAMTALTNLVLTNPDIGSKLEAQARKSFTTAYERDPVKEKTALATVERGEGPPVNLWEDRTEEGKNPRLNPLYEAALLERLQFDGDAPELRGGPIAPGVEPAVPVDTEARSPAAIGSMMQQASDEVAEEVGVKQREWARQVEGEFPLARKLTAEELAVVLSKGDPHPDLPHWRITYERDTDSYPFREYTRIDGQTLAGSHSEEQWAAMLRHVDETSPTEEAQAPVPIEDLPPVPAPRGYEPGRLPAKRSVEAPSGAVLSTMTPEQKREMGWKFISTTHGRRSVEDLIWRKVGAKLHELGFPVSPDPATKGNGKPLAHHEWTMEIDGPQATQSEFAAVDIAFAALAKGLERGLPSDPQTDEEWALAVRSVNRYSSRRVGWEARIQRVG